MTKKKLVEPIPDEFSSYEEAANFWDAHDSTDYLQDSRAVEVSSEFRGRRYEIEIEPGVIQALRTRARKKGIPVSRLANELLRQQLAAQKAG